MQPLALHVLCMLLTCVSASRILLQPFAHCRNSHVLNFEKLASILLAEHHDVYMLVPSGYHGPYSSADLRQLRWLHFDVPDELSEICSFTSLDATLTTPLLDVMTSFYSSTHRVCDALLSNKQFLQTLRGMNFDLAIYDAVDPCCRIMADYLNIPFIVFNTQGLENILPRHPAYLPCLLSSFTNQMTLKQRVLNTVCYIIQKVISQSILYYYNGLKIKHHMNVSLSLADTYDRAAVRFILGDYGLDYVGPTQPSHVLIGGYIAAPASIDRTIMDFIDSGDFRDVLVVSMGSMIQEYGPHWREVFAEAIGSVPYQVIWRYNDDERPSLLGNNTMLLPWLPQVELLALARTKAFVTHCGMNAVYEAAQNGVPVVGIPLYGDQFYQANKIAKHAGMGVILPEVRKMTSDALRDAIWEIRENHRYHDNAKRVSYVLRNRPFSQQEQVTRWVEHVVRHHGAPHLHSEAYYALPWYQFFLCDVFLIVLIIALFVLAILTVITLKIIGVVHHWVSSRFTLTIKKLS